MPHRLRGLLCLLLVAACGSYLPPGAPLAHAIQEDEEARIGRQFRREAKKHLKLVNHPEVERYVDQVGRRLLSVMGPQSFDYRFFVVEDSQLNAFAVPGGSIYVYTGLLERAKSTGEFAGVMGHEIIHVKDRHMARMSGPDPLSLLGLLGMILARGGAGAQAAAALGQALSATRAFAYTRQLEREADTLGVRYMAQAGYDPREALGFLKTIDQQRILNATDLPPYLMTHPLTQERIANVELVIRSLNQEQPKSEGPDPIKRIQVILRLERHEGDAVIGEYEKLVGQSPESAELRHLLALAQHHQGRWPQARENYEKARALDRRRLGIDRDLGRLYSQTGDFRLAREAFDRSLRAEPRESLNHLFSGELFEREANLREAANAYLSAHNLSPLSPFPPRRLGIVYGKMNRLGDAYYYLGRSDLLQDEDEKAMANFERAIKILGPTSARGQEIKEELETLKARRR